MKTYLFALTIAVALIGAGCGDDDDGGGNTAAPTDPRAQELLAILEADEEFPLSESEANCTVNRMVADLDSSTIDQILANPDGDISDSASPEENLKAMNALLDCADIEALMVESMVADGTDREAAECLASGFGEDELRSFMESAALPEDQVDEEAAFEIIGKMFELAVECGLDFE